MATDRKFITKNGLDAGSTAIDNAGTNGSSLQVSGAFAVTLTATAATNVTLPTTGTLLTTAGNVATATALQTTRTFNLSGVTTGGAQNFNGSQNVVIAVTAVPAALLTGTIADARISGSYTGMTNLTGTGTVDFASFLGNAADGVTAPSFSWAGDTNTGVYTPGADQVGITAGGTQRLLVNSSGVTVTGTATATTFSGSGASLTALNATQLTTGTVADGRLSSNVALLSGAQTFTGQKTFNFPILMGTNATFDVNGSAASAQQNGLYIADLGGTQGTTLNPAFTAAIVGQVSTSRSIAISVDASGYLWGFRTHSNAATYTFQSKVQQADTLTTGRTFSLTGDATGTSAAFDGSANASIAVTLPNVATAGTYRSVTINAKGLVTAGTNPTTLAGYGITDAQAFDADLTSIAALAGTGLLRKTAANTWSLDTTTFLTGNQTITLSGDLSGSGTTAITGTLATVNSNVGTFGTATQVGTFTVNAKGLITAASNTAIQIAETQITDGAVLARNAGNETITGTWAFNNNITVPATPTADSHAASKQYVDNMSTGLDMKQSVRVATTANITLSGTQTIDGIAVIAGDRVLVKNQTTASQNGIYVVAAGAWARSTDADNSPVGEVTSSMYSFVEQGTTNADSGWVLSTPNPITLGTTALTFVQFTGIGQLVAGAGLTKTGSTVDIGTASTARIVVNADNIDLATVTDGGGGSFLKFTRDTYGRVSGTSAVVAGDITPLVDASYVNIGGDTMTGALTINAAASNLLRISNSTGLASTAVLSLDPGNNGFGVRDAQIRAVNNGSNQVSMQFFTANALAPAQRMSISEGGVVAMLANVGATSTTTGTLVVTGGVGISENLRVGGGIHGNGANITSLNASNLASGTVPDARIAGTYTGLTDLTGTGDVDFSRFLGNGADSAGAPSFTWTGDTNTGIFTPGADQLAVSTGGVERGRFSSAGFSSTGFVTAEGGIRFGSADQPTYGMLLDFGSDVAGTWRKIVGATLQNAQFSTHGFAIDVTDPKSNQASTASVGAVLTERYYVAMVRTEGTTLDTPDACYVTGPGNRIRAIKTALGSYEIQIQNEGQFREYKVLISTYASNGSHSITYFPGTTAGTATATYTATVSTAENVFQEVRIAGTSASTTTTTGALKVAGGVGVVGAINAGSMTLGTALPIASGGTASTTAAGARTNLGATTVGDNLFTLTNPSAIRFIRVNADNTVSALDAATFRTAIGAGTAAGTVTSVSVATANGISGSVASATTTPSITLSLGAITPTSVNVSAGALGTTAGNTVIAQVLQGTTTNTCLLETFLLREAAGTDWTTSSFRTQARTDSTYQAWQEFNGNGNQHGISWGTGSNSVLTSVAERMVLDSSGRLSLSANIASTTTGTGTIVVTGGIGVSGQVTAATFSGSGASMTSLNASNLSSGTVPDARISGAYSGITNLTMDGVLINGSGTNGRVHLHAGNPTSSGYIAFHSHTSATRQGYIGFSSTNASNDAGTIPYVAGTHAFSGVISGNGSGLTTLNASNLSSGTVPDARISGSYTGLTNLTGTGTVDFSAFAGNAADSVTTPSFTFTGDTNTGMYSPAADQVGITGGGTQRLLVNSSGITVTGTATATTFSGSGASLTALNASQLTTGTLPDARLSSAVLTNTSSNVTSGVKQFQSAGTVGANISPPLQAYATGTDAAWMSFHRASSYAINIGLDNDNVFRIGGWSDGTNVFRLQIGTGGLVQIPLTTATTAPSAGFAHVGYRSIPRETSTTLNRASVGKCHAIAAGVTVPASTFAEGDAVTIYNNSASAITLTQGSGLTLRLAGGTATGDRTLDARGMATIWFNSATEAIASGAGLT